MNRRRAAQGAKLSLAMTPMIDVVFLLLVFFVCTVRFERREEVYQLDLPVRGASADPFALEESPVELRIGARSRSQLAIELRADGVVRTVATFDDLTSLLTSLQRPRSSATAAPEALFEATHPILVVPEPLCEWQDAVDAFNAALRARYTNIGFAEIGS